MAKNYASLAFTEEIKKLQEKIGSRSSYARMEQNSYIDGLTENEMHFISQRDSFYMATIGANDFPYIQYRGGPKGFLKVLTPTRIGFIDFRGNMQYISTGNIATNNHVSLILLDYPARARLKIYAKASIIQLEEAPALLASLELGDYKFRPERMMVFDIEAYDWNCPQHIIPRYTVEEMEEIYMTQLDHIATLQEEIKDLKARLKE